ncbi:IQ motif [Macleaya cordata]|uniref:IQ motif n=1 Tax=Macleaya cordata TaxID=56857 RepID=A0A200R288_MACCD|nr:IQ motif [Macleaya cordata]
MESSAVVRLAGAEIHGFHTWADLDVDKMMEEASSRWLRPNEIHAILYNATLFTIHVKPMHLPKSGKVVLFDRKMLRNFRRDGHNWKKKKDGKTVKEAHEHLKVGNEERIHVYYAHGQDNPSFVRRCYWLLDKKHEHIVLVHYRETLEMQGSPVTPVTSNSGSHSDTSTSRVLLDETDSGANHSFCSGTSLVGTPIQLDGNMTVSNHEKRIHEINTLEWDDLLVLIDPSDSAHEKDNNSCLEQGNRTETNESKSNSTLLPSTALGVCESSFGSSTNRIATNPNIDVRLPTSGYFQELDTQTNSNVQREGFELNTKETDGLRTQDSFGRWMNYVMTDSPGSLDGLPVESPISNGNGSSITGTMDHHHSSVQQQVFSITEISPAWGFSTEETKVIVVGYFHGGPSQLADSNLVMVLGDECVPAEMIQHGVYRCRALPHNPGLVNLYLSLDGHTPISQVMDFEYRSPSMVNEVASPKDEANWEEFQVQIRLAHLLFSATNSLNILSSKVSPNVLKEAKKFVQATSSIVKDWDYLIKSIGKNEISFPQAQRSLFEISLKNKLQEWLLERMLEGSKTSVRDHQGQGIIHLCAILGYTWAIRPYSRSGLSLDFRDAHGWTALHWAAYYGREEMVAVLLSAGANASLVTDPTSEFPGGCTCADLASQNGFDGLAAYLAEKGLTEHFRLMSISGNISGSLQTSATDFADHGNLNEEELCQKETLAAYRTAADAAARIQAAFRENSLKLRTKAVQLANPEMEARNIISAMRIQRAFRNYESRKKMAAAARIQYTFRTWKIRKEFLFMRRQAIRIQAAFRGLQARKQYRKIIWSVGVLEKAIIRWRKKRKGFRGLQVEPTMVDLIDQKEESDVEEDFFKISRKQAEERVERSVVRVQSLFRSYRAQQQYRRMKLAYDQAELDELFGPDT